MSIIGSKVNVLDIDTLRAFLSDKFEDLDNKQVKSQKIFVNTGISGIQFDLKMGIDKYVYDPENPPIFSENQFSLDEYKSCLFEPILIPSKEKGNNSYYFETIYRRCITLITIIDYISNGLKNSFYLELIVDELKNCKSWVSNLEFTHLNLDELSNMIEYWYSKEEQMIIISFSHPKSYFENEKYVEFEILDKLKQTDWFRLMKRLGLITCLEEKWQFTDSDNSLVDLSNNHRRMGELLACLYEGKVKPSNRSINNFRKYYSEILNQNIKTKNSSIEDILKRLKLQSKK
jgi:hypothetical protein